MIQEHELITSEKVGGEVSGEINSNTVEEEADDERQELEEDIHALEMRRSAVTKNYQEAQRRIQEIKTNPGSGSENMKKVNLELLNHLQDEVNKYKDIHAELEKQIDEFKNREDELTK